MSEENDEGEIIEDEIEEYVYEGLILSPEIVDGIVDGKLAITDPPGFVADTPPVNIPVIKMYGRAGLYSNIEFTASHPDIPNSTRLLKCFVKTLIGSDRDFNMRNTVGFNREVSLYTLVFPRILYREDGDIVPQCIYAQKNKVIVLDDMMSRDYTIVDKMQSLSFSHMCVAAKALGRFHSRSVIHEKKVSGHSLAYDCEGAWNIELQTRHYSLTMKSIYDINAQSLYDIFKWIPELIPFDPLDFREAVKATVSNLYHVISSEDFSPLRVLAHTDLTPSNLLFRYDADGEPEACCMVDFAYVKYTSPALDLWSFIYNNTTKELRNELLDDIQDIYYDEFTECLMDAEIDVDEVFSYKDFMQILANDRVYGLIHSLLTLGQELRQEMTNRYGDEFREMWLKLWMNSPEFMHEDTDELIRYKHRIVQGLVELYPFLIPHTPKHFPKF